MIAIVFIISLRQWYVSSEPFFADLIEIYIDQYHREIVLRRSPAQIESCKRVKHEREKQMCF